MEAFQIVQLVIGWAVPFALGAIVAWVSKSLKQQREENDAIKAGVRALLYDRIVQGYTHYHDDLGYMPINNKESMQEVYETYRKLGGNGLGRQMYERMCALPTQKGEE